ncbi:MAG: hypothetical protein ABJH45_12275, partial [Paracoccaceae bacterium]
LTNWIFTHRDLMHSITLEIFTEIWLPHNRLLASKLGKKTPTVLGAIHCDLITAAHDVRKPQQNGTE